MRYPKTLYETPTEWGEVFWLSRRELDQAIVWLKRLWQHDQPPSIQECTRWEHVGGGFYRKAMVRKEDQETRYFWYDKDSRSWIPSPISHVRR